MAVKKKVVEIETKLAATSIKDLRTLLKELKNLMLSTTEGTEEYNEALRKAAEITHTLSEQTLTIKASAADFGEMVSNTNKVLGGMTAGFQAAQATMNLFGVESEDVMKSLLKMQSLMSLTQALPALDAGYKAFKNLSTAISTVTGATSAWGKALISTGIGALVVALGYLIANFEEISKWLDEITGETDFLGKLSDKVMGGLNAAWAAVVQSLKAVGKAIVTYVTTPVKGIVNAVNAFTSTQGGIGEKLKAAAKAMKDGFVSDWKDVGNDFKQIGTKASEAYEDGFKTNQERRMKKAQEDAKKNGTKIGKTNGTAAGKASADARKKELDAACKKLLEDEKKLAEELAKLYADLAKEISLYNKTEEEKQIIALQEEENAKLDIIRRYYKIKNDEDLKNNEEAQKIMEEYEKRITEIKNKETNERLKKEEEERLARLDLLKEWVSDTEFNYAPELEQIATKEAEELAILEEAHNNNLLEDERYQALKTDILAKYGEQRTEIEKAEAEKRKNIQMSTMNAYFNIANSFADILGSLADAMDENNKEQFEVAKAFNISSAVINTITGAIGAYTGAASNPGLNAIPIVGPGLAIAMGVTNAAAVAASGAVQIAKLAQTKFGDKNASGARVSASPSSTAVSSINTPVQYTQDIQGASIEGAIKDTRVYVTEGDISSTQKKVDVAESEARF